MTPDKIVTAASRLFYQEGIGHVSMDDIAAKAGVTKRTLYYHFRSKDDLIAATLAKRDQPNLALFEKWFAETEGDVADKTRGLFSRLAQSARHAKWRGCAFLRTTAELASMPGHPAIKAGIAHKKRLEDWLQARFAAADLVAPADLARQVMLLLDGSFAVVLLNRDPSYMETAGAAAHTLVSVAAGARRGQTHQPRTP